MDILADCNHTGMETSKKTERNTGGRMENVVRTEMYL